MKFCPTIKCRLFFAIAAILACSYAILFLTSLSTLQRFIGDQSEKDLQFSLKFANIQFNARQESVLTALKLPAATQSIQNLFLAGDNAELRKYAKKWADSFEFIEVLTIFDKNRNVIARSNSHREPESFLSMELLNTVFERKQPVLTTVIVSHDKYCLEVSSTVCQSLPENRDVMVQLVYLPVVDAAGNVLGVIVAGNDINTDPHLGFEQQKVFGKTIEVLIAQKGEIISSTIKNSGGFVPNLEAKVTQSLKTGYQFHGTTALKGRQYEMIAVPIYDHRGEVIGSIAVALSDDRYDGLRNDNYRNLVRCGLFSSLLILVLAYFTAWKFTAPMRRFSAAIKAIEDGDYSTRISVKEGLEFTVFAETFNRMSEALHERDSVIMSQHAELKEINSQLENKAFESDIKLDTEIKVQKAIIRNLLDGIIVTDDRQMIIEINPAAEKMLGVKASTLLGGTVATLYERPGLGALQKLCEQGSGADLSETDSVVILMHKNRNLRFSLINLQDEQDLLRGGLLVVRDVTADGAVDGLKSGFIAKISHELKTPLTSMKGSLQFILKKGKWLTGVEREMLTVCYRNTERLIGLVTGIIELSRIEAGQIIFSMKPLQIGEIVLYAIEGMKGEALRKNVYLVNDVPMDLPKVYGDYERLIQVLSNILSNAVKFSPINSVVTVRAGVEKTYLTIFVADNGHVIREEARASLFSRFQLSGLPEEAEGSGSGISLAICREIMERHGGSIFYEPGADGGNVFAFRVPLEGAFDE